MLISWKSDRDNRRVFDINPFSSSIVFTFIYLFVCCILRICVAIDLFMYVSIYTAILYWFSYIYQLISLVLDPSPYVGNVTSCLFYVSTYVQSSRPSNESILKVVPQYRQGVLNPFLEDVQKAPWKIFWVRIILLLICLLIMRIKRVHRIQLLFMALMFSLFLQEMWRLKSEVVG